MNYSVVDAYLEKIKQEISNLHSADDFVASMREYLDDYCDAHPDCTLNDLEAEFGTPAEVAGEFLESMGVSKASKVQNLRKSRRTMIIAAIVLAIITVCVIMIFEHILNNPKPVMEVETETIILEPGETVEDYS